MIAWGQYIHWANLQYKYHEQLVVGGNPESACIGAKSHWVAAQYVVIEGWCKLRESDDLIDNLLDSYPDYIDIFRRCRNAVYHYQNEILDKRIQEALLGDEQYNWLVVIKCEFERYLYLYPFKYFGFNKHALEFSDTYYGCIGWIPDENIKVRWYRIYSTCMNYMTNNDLNDLAINKENDAMIASNLELLKEIEPNFLLASLSRVGGS
jgi:hypothetical protein